MTPARRRELFSRLSAFYPNARGGLNADTPFELLVAVVLSAQTTDVAVNRATKKLFQVANTPETVLALGEEGLKSYIRSIGLYNVKARNLISLCLRLIDGCGGQVPKNREALRELPGVGWKTASVVANVAFGQPTIAVDTHVFRVACRTGLASGNSRDAISRRLEEITPREYRQNAHHWLILLGRNICKARRPECWRCPIEDLCSYTAKTPAPEIKRVIAIAAHSHATPIKDGSGRG